MMTEGRTIAGPERDVVIVWLAKGRKRGAVDFDRGERWTDLDAAIVHAREAGRRADMDSWIRCDGKFVLSPDDIAAAYDQLR